MLLDPSLMGYNASGCRAVSFSPGMVIIRKFFDLDKDVRTLH